jgi:uncharacterized LabA/DUF88 family protein
MTMKKPLNNYAFIDGQNLNLGIQDIGWKLDFTRFRVYLKEKYGVSTAFYFIGKVAENNELYEALQNAGYILIYKEVLTDPFGKAKGNIDAELVLQAMVEYKNYDKAVIVSGDGDFACLVTYLDNNHKLERVIVPNMYRYSALLKKAASTRLDTMNELKRKLAYTFSRKKTDGAEKPVIKKQTLSKPRVQKEIPAKPTQVLPEAPKAFTKKFRYPRKKNTDYSKPALQNPVTQKQIPAKPTQAVTEAPKPFAKKFRYPRNKNTNYNKPAFKNPVAQQQISEKPITTAFEKPKTFSKQFRRPVNKNVNYNKPQLKNPTTQKHIPAKPQITNQIPVPHIPVTPPTVNQTSNKPVTTAQPAKKSFFKFRFNKHSIFKKRTP